MTNKIKQPTPRVHLQAYFRLQKLTAAIQRGRFPNKQDLARLTERTPRTVQRDLRELVNTFEAPLAFDRAENGFYFTDPEWRLPTIQLTEGELITNVPKRTVVPRRGRRRVYNRFLRRESFNASRPQSADL